MAHANTQFFLHVPAPPSDPRHTTPPVDHVLLAIDTPMAQLTMRLPIGCRGESPPHAYWDAWLACLQSSFLAKFHTTTFDRDILLNIVCLYWAFTISQRIHVNSDFYDGFTLGFLEITRGALGRCIKHDLALYVIDMHILVPLHALDEAPLSFLSCYYPEPTTPDSPDSDLLPNLPFPSPPSPAISAAVELADASADDSGYESSNTMPSLRTVEDLSDEYYSDSSEDPDSDSEKEGLIG